MSPALSAIVDISHQSVDNRLTVTCMMIDYSS